MIPERAIDDRLMLAGIRRALVDSCSEVDPVVQELVENALVEEMPTPDSKSKWLDQLGALAELTRHVVAIYIRKVGPDVGGRTNVHKEFFNSPEFVLIRFGWDHFERFRPGQATTSETGDFHLFLQQIYEYATGKGANEDGAPALIPKIKQMLKPLRDYAVNIEYLRLAEEMEAKFLIRLMNGASTEELEASIEELDEISAKVDPKAASVLMASTTRKRVRS